MLQNPVFQVNSIAKMEYNKRERCQWVGAIFLAHAQPDDDEDITAPYVYHW